MTLNLWRAEWLKTRKRPANLIMLISLNTIALFFVAGVFLLAKVNGGAAIKDAATLLPFPRSLELATGTIGGFAKLLAIVFMANNIGSEYSHDTWKMILPRYGSRTAFLFTKLISGLVMMLIFFATTLLTWIVASWFAAWLLGLPLMGGMEWAGAITISQLKLIALTMLEMMLFGMLTFLATIAIRSIIGGVVSGLIGLTVLEIAGQLPFHYLALSIPTTHISNLYGHWLGNTNIIAFVNNLFGRGIAPGVSIAVVAGYLLFFLITGIMIFRRRDMAGA